MRLRQPLRRIVRIASCVAVISSGCAVRTAPPAPGRPDEPRASWQISAWPQDGRPRILCRSDQGRPCVVEASTDRRPTFAAVSVYLYPVGARTTYRGAFLSGFMRSAAGKGHETKVDYEIDPGKVPTAVNALDRVTSQPGDYECRIALFAEVPGHTDPYQYVRTIPVRVAPPANNAASRSSNQ